MPVYKHGTKIGAEKRIEFCRPNIKRKFKARRRWGDENSSLRAIEWDLSFRITEHVAELAKKSTTVVVDWGCGKGAAIAELVAQIPKSRGYGFSGDSFREWNEILNGNKAKKIKPATNVTFIHADANDFFRYFRNNSIDVLYSHLGLEHLDNQLEYLKRLISKLKKGGIIVCRENGAITSLTPLIGNRKAKTETRKYATNITHEVEVYRLPEYEVEFMKYSQAMLIRRIQ